MLRLLRLPRFLRTSILRLLLHFSDKSTDSLFDRILGLAAVLARSDGVISRNEISILDRYLGNELGIRTYDRLRALRSFNLARKRRDSPEAIAERIYRDVSGNPILLEAILDILFAIAYADSNYCAAEERLLNTVAQIFRLSPESLQRIEARAEQLYHGRQFQGSRHESRTQFETRTESYDSRSQSFKILGCSPDDSVEEIKRKYRELVKEFHPDMVLGLGAPPEFKKEVEARFRSIQEAYEEVRSIKGFV